MPKLISTAEVARDQNPYKEVGKGKETESIQGQGKGYSHALVGGGRYQEITTRSLAIGCNASGQFGYAQLQNQQGGPISWGNKPEVETHQRDTIAWHRYEKSKNPLGDLHPEQIGHRLWTSYQIMSRDIQKDASNTEQAGTTATTTVYDGKGNLITATLGGNTNVFAVIRDKEGKVLKVSRLNRNPPIPTDSNEKSRIVAAGGYVAANGKVGTDLTGARSMGNKYNRGAFADAIIDITNIDDLAQKAGITTAEIGSVQIITTSKGFTRSVSKQEQALQEQFLKEALGSDRPKSSNQRDYQRLDTANKGVVPDMAVSEDLVRFAESRDFAESQDFITNLNYFDSDDDDEEVSTPKPGPSGHISVAAQTLSFKGGKYTDNLSIIMTDKSHALKEYLINICEVMANIFLFFTGLNIISLKDTGALLVSFSNAHESFLKVVQNQQTEPAADTSGISQVYKANYNQVKGGEQPDTEAGPTPGSIM